MPRAQEIKFPESNLKPIEIIIIIKKKKEAPFPRRDRENKKKRCYYNAFGVFVPICVE